MFKIIIYVEISGYTMIMENIWICHHDCYEILLNSLDLKCYTFSNEKK